MEATFEFEYAIEYVFEDFIYTIRENEQVHGMLEEDDLDRKIRNLKHHYKTIKDNNKKTKTGQGRIVWEYYQMFEEIFVDDRTINHGVILSSLPPASSIPPVTALPFPPVSTLPFPPVTALSFPPSTASSSSNMQVDNYVSVTEEYGLSTSIQQSTPTVNVTTSTPMSKSKKKVEKAREGRGLYRFRNTHLELEARRVAALENLVKELAENNRIQQERNVILKNQNRI
ncbi:unnamed protein product [Psylliodes chrysocephalus]|uniref:MADF domain-containing protein n=1 Tax=Psylliodes chrysocephalus TaxID=3402493 RepID=A0A9P0D378_9CUCU|nr:unnamed protein product [Psylliodes chrysocephala]